MLPSFQATSELTKEGAIGKLVAEGPAPLTAGAEVPGRLAAAGGFSGKSGESLVSESGGVVEILAGTGPSEGFGITEARRAGATLARAARKEGSLAVDLRGVAAAGEGPERLAQAVVEGVAGALYSYERYRSGAEEAGPREVSLVVEGTALERARRGVERGRAVAEAVSFARDLSNCGPSDLTPRAFAEQAGELAGRSGLSCEVMDEEEAAREGLGGLLGVGRGSAEPPRLIKLTYEPDESVARRGADGRLPTVVLVGKGITFDSGGLSLKTGEGMIGMKGDMSGAAAVVATAGACRALGVGVRVVAIAPTTENMPGGRAIKPGDVLRIRNGKTIEVLNTDAEGRLVLADGLSLAAEMEPDAIVDVATLTGACVVALGSKLAGVMGNDSEVVGAIERAGARAGEAFWRLPLPRAYRKDIDSPIADMKNIGKARQAGALIAGLVLEEFVDERPWAHLDIAGVYDSDEESFDLRKGATGFGVRTLLEFVESFEPSAEAGRRADHLGVG